MPQPPSKTTLQLLRRQFSPRLTRVLPPLSRTRAGASFRNNHPTYRYGSAIAVLPFISRQSHSRLFSTFLPDCYADEDDALFLSPTPVEINSIQRSILTTTPVPLMDDQMIDMAFTTQLDDLTDKWFYRPIKDGALLAPIKLGRSSRWLKSEVKAWLQAHIAQPRP